MYDARTSLRLVVAGLMYCRRRGRFFYRMVEGSVPQWILTHPMAKAPRAGDGLFPGEVIEVTQVSRKHRRHNLETAVLTDRFFD